MIGRSIFVWMLIILVEMLHGIARTRFLEPHVGDRKARQLGVITGSLLIFILSLLLVPWIDAGSAGQLLFVGLLWAILTVAFELIFGRYVAHFSWERLLSDYNLKGGGLMPLGLLSMILSPWLASLLREV